MRVELNSIIEGIEFQTDETKSFLKISTGEVVLFANEEISVAERNEDVSEEADWYIKAIERAKEFLDNEQDYIPLPPKYEFNEYSVMKEFILSLPIETQKKRLWEMIKGKGAFARFKSGLNQFLLIDSWYQYRNNALVEFAKGWCLKSGIEVK